MWYRISSCRICGYYLFNCLLFKGHSTLKAKGHKIKQRNSFLKKNLPKVWQNGHLLERRSFQSINTRGIVGASYIIRYLGLKN